MNRAKVRSGSCFQGSKKARLNGSGAIALDSVFLLPSLVFVYLLTKAWFSALTGRLLATLLAKQA